MVGSRGLVGPKAFRLLCSLVSQLHLAVSSLSFVSLLKSDCKLQRKFPESNEDWEDFVKIGKRFTRLDCFESETEMKQFGVEIVKLLTDWEMKKISWTLHGCSQWMPTPYLVDSQRLQMIQLRFTNWSYSRYEAIKNNEKQQPNFPESKDVRRIIRSQNNHETIQSLLPLQWASNRLEPTSNSNKLNLHPILVIQEVSNLWLHNRAPTIQSPPATSTCNNLRHPEKPHCASCASMLRSSPIQCIRICFCAIARGFVHLRDDPKNNGKFQRSSNAKPKSITKLAVPSRTRRTRKTFRSKEVSPCYKSTEFNARRARNSIELRKIFTCYSSVTRGISRMVNKSPTNHCGDLCET